jgi:hypothetical protein
MHWILFLPDIRLYQKTDIGHPAGYPVIAGYRISGRKLLIQIITCAIFFQYGKVNKNFWFLKRIKPKNLPFSCSLWFQEKVLIVKKITEE